MNRSALLVSVLPLLTLPFMACGVDARTSSSFEDGAEFGETSEALVVSNLSLSEERKAALIGTYRDLAASVFGDAHEVAALPEETAVAVLDVSGVIESARMRQVREIWVPAGTSAAPRDPNLSRSFYVVFHDTDASTIYGPFEVRGLEGHACGSTIAGALPRCREDLTCVSSGHPDEPGVCSPS